MPEPTIRHGGCLCGAVRYSVSGDPFKTGICHCADCRKVTGTSFLSYADWHPEQFRTTGEVREYSGRSFCPSCGSRVFSISDDQVEIYLGSLDDAPNGIAPQAEIWVKRREPWLSELEIAQFQQDPP